MHGEHLGTRTLDDQVNLLFTQIAMEVGKGLNFSLYHRGGIGDLGLDIEVDIPASCGVIDPRSEQPDLAVLAEMPAQGTEDDLALCLGESHGSKSLISVTSISKRVDGGWCVWLMFRWDPLDRWLAIEQLFDGVFIHIGLYDGVACHVVVIVIVVAEGGA